MRLLNSEDDVFRLPILIHASARDATNMVTDSLKGVFDFNPRIREGCDQRPALLLLKRN